MDNKYYYELLDKVMPRGSSCCSKHAVYVPEEPAVIVSGKGCRVKDADGREFIDFRNALGPISLGYAYEPVNAAIREQLEKGITFGYPSPLEAEVAQLITEIIPCAEKARFLKTGGEAIAACIKAARYITGREHVIQIGYNGWLNTLGGSTMILPGQPAPAQVPGIPAALSALHHGCDWNDTDKLQQLADKYKGTIAAIVVAADYTYMEKGATFYPFLRNLADEIGCALIFDEIVTGFRMALGGVQEYFHVTPDMAVFAKGIANGMPLSVYCGKAKWMDAFENATVSSTYGGEALSLAAAKAVIGIYRTEPVIEHFWKMGIKMWGGLQALFDKYALPVKMGTVTRPVMFYSYTKDAPADFPSKMERAILTNGVTLYHGGYINYSHTEADIAEALSRIESALKSL